MGIPHGCPLACDPAWDTEEMITKQFMLDGMLIAVAAPDDYAGPLEFYSATLPDSLKPPVCDLRRLYAKQLMTTPLLLFPQIGAGSPWCTEAPRVNTGSK
jgi:hypothetical protein